jgi:hypothetical protein
MTKPIQFTFTAEQMAQFLAWRARVEADTAKPLEGVMFSWLVSYQGALQLIIRPSTEEDFKLPNVPRADGTSDPFAPYEEILAAYDDVGFAATLIVLRDVRLRLWLLDGTILERGETPRCYVECLDEPQRPFVPFRLSEQPGVLADDPLCTVFSSMPLPPLVSNLVETFIRTNVTTLLQHWRGETDSRDLLDALQPPGSFS